VTPIPQVAIRRWRWPVAARSAAATPRPAGCACSGRYASRAATVAGRVGSSLPRALCRHRGSRGIRAAGAGRPEVPARPGPGWLPPCWPCGPRAGSLRAFWDNCRRRPSRHQQPSFGPLTRAPACLLPVSGVLRPDPYCASSSAFSGVNPACRVTRWLRSQESCWKPAPENASSQDCDWPGNTPSRTAAPGFPGAAGADAGNTAGYHPVCLVSSGPVVRDGCRTSEGAGTHVRLGPCCRTVRPRSP
jgi:hypothetical protein